MNKRFIEVFILSRHKIIDIQDQEDFNTLYTITKNMHKNDFAVCKFAMMYINQTRQHTQLFIKLKENKFNIAKYCNIFDYYYILYKINYLENTINTIKIYAAHNCKEAPVVRLGNEGNISLFISSNDIFQVDVNVLANPNCLESESISCPFSASLLIKNIKRSLRVLNIVARRKTNPKTSSVRLQINSGSHLLFSLNETIADTSSAYRLTIKWGFFSLLNLEISINRNLVPIIARIELTDFDKELDNAYLTGHIKKELMHHNSFQQNSLSSRLIYFKKLTIKFIFSTSVIYKSILD
ncbi:hypothetical protein AGLY_009395 [Aphis glycines]|uniref:Uncharacterized protein n=1 Tax=Aphis glycines TaxID=307491 RepID=A0A6G0TIL9_APHGL|nr:hypothetical protein AGLY_009395 [Aphis glycines]